jgi:tetratricopeptide (TPR) repeat protein
MRRRTLALPIVLLLAAALLAPGSARGEIASGGDATLEAFVKACGANAKLDAALRDKAAALVAERRNDPDRRADALTDALAVLYPAFGQALVQLAGDQTDAAVATLSNLAKSDDPYLRAHAAFFLGRTHVYDEHFEQARPLLAPLADGASGGDADKTLYVDQATFLLGVCQAQLLDRDAARKTLTRFLQKYPGAPERMSVGAIHMLAELNAVEDGSIVDVHDRMDFAHRRLALGDSGKPTQEQHEKIVAMLDKLIEEAEKKEKEGGGGGGGGGAGGSGPPSGNNQPSSPATQSSAPVGEARIGTLSRVNRGSAEDTWGNLKTKDREKVLAALKARFPDRYQELVEQYFKSLQDESK